MRPQCESALGGRTVHVRISAIFNGGNTCRCPVVFLSEDGLLVPTAGKRIPVKQNAVSAKLTSIIVTGARQILIN